MTHENIHYPKMEALEARENSLKTFPLKSSTFRSKLADAGFFYFDYIDYVQCFCCGGCLRTWSIDDDPLERHIERFPYCTFHVDIRKSNTEASHIPMPPCLDEASHSETLEEMVVDKLIQKYDSNYYRENFSDVANRRLTFEKFKASTDVEIDESVFQQYAEAGFFYYGVKEDVVCFSCILGLAQISKDINPWALHLQFAPTCIYVTSNIDKFKSTVTETQASDATDPYIEFELNMH
ncbi:baculoviral IAP repeat-containing protein 2-like [Mytilus trossulus]|uniref:baculoviral IAP repeat-containing protein 2-like n=1 Tax=Mytilus trossulus TaxID=6551 RepID=UPI003007C396